MIIFVLRHSLGVLAPLLWAVNMQLGLVLPYKDCTYGLRWTLIASLVVASCSIISAAILQSRRPISRTGLFVARLEALLAVGFVFAVLLQGAASALLDPCLH